MSASETADTIERAWNDLLREKPTDGFTNLDLRTHLAGRYDIHLSSQMLHGRYLKDALKDGKLEPLGNNPIHYILKKGDEAMAKKKKKDPSKLDGGGVNNAMNIDPAIAVDHKAATPEAVPPDDQHPLRKISPRDAANILGIYRSMLEDHGFKQAARDAGCDFRFTKADVATEAESEPVKFQRRFDKFEAAMVSTGLKEIFDACSEIKGLCMRNFSALAKFMGRDRAEELCKMAKEDINDLRKQRKESVLTTLDHVRQAVKEYEEYEKKKQRAQKPAFELDPARFGRKPAAKGKTEAAEKPTTEGPVADSSATVPPPVVEPPIPVNPPTPAPTPVVETEAAKPPHDDVVALQEKVNSLTDQVRLVSQERDGGQLKLNAALAQVARLEDELKASNKTRERFEGDLEIANGKYAGLTKVLDDEKIAHHNTMSEKTALEQQVRELTAKVDALPKLQQPAATRWARIGVLGRRVQQSPISRTIAFVLIAALILVVFLQPSFKNWKVYSQPAKVADAPAAISDTRSEETLKLQQELDREFEAFKTATQQKGAGQ